MILVIGLLISQVLFGYTLVSWANIKASRMERFLYSIVSGIIVGSWILFILQMFLELNAVSIFLSIIILVIASYKTIRKYSSIKLSQHRKIKLEIIKKQAKENKFVILFFVILFIILSFLNYTHNLEPKQDGLYSGRNNWGDLAGHLSMIMTFVENANKNLEHPLYAYRQISYPFLFNFFTASLVSGGMPIREALLLPGIILAMTIFLLFYFLAKQITQNKKIALLSLVLFTFVGGFGFIYFLEDLQNNKVNLSRLPDYTYYTDEKIVFSNLIGTLVLPQRTFLIGFPVAFIVFSILWRWFNRKADKKELIFASVIIGLLPFFHGHTFFSLGFISVALFFLDLKFNIFNSSYKQIFSKRLKAWIIFFLIIAIFSVPQIIFLTSSLTDKIGKGFLQLFLGWMAKDQNWLVFWAFNLGTFFILALPAYLLAKRRLKIFYLPFLGLFVLSNLFVFQPYDFDNIKVFYMWLPIHSILIAILIYKIFEKNKVVTTLIVFLSIFSGILSVISEAQTSYRLYGYTEVELGKWVRENTPKDAVFVTYAGHDHFVPGLGGRRILVGFEGWLWTWGISDSWERIVDVKKIYIGGSESIKLLEKYSIDYLVIGPAERYNYQANETFFDNNLHIVKEYNGYKIYKV